MKRASGILLHPTSLPGPFGIGDMGPSARKFVDFLQTTLQSYWQILPIGPVAFGDSPYQSPSAFAGNPLWISPEKLIEMELLKPSHLHKVPNFPKEYVNFAKAREWKETTLHKAFHNFQQSPNPELKHRFSQFCHSQTLWLEDYACFMAIKETQDLRSWHEWPAEFALRQPYAISKFKKEHQESIQFHKFTQFIFTQQWAELKTYANERGVKIFGDIPIFVADDSSDVWANPELFELDQEGNPTIIAGVPPDYFSSTGQRWGNPLYRWARMKENRYKWWKQRLQTMLTAMDLLRIDHFRGFDQYWAIPESEPTAIHGTWMDGPGLSFFRTLQEDLGELPIVAEDLGMITDSVLKLRDDCGFPGMKILHFAFGGDTNHTFLPHSYNHQCVVYTGTHDNNTTTGWWKEISDPEKQYLERYANTKVTAKNVASVLIHMAWSSPAVLAIAPLQDFLNLNAKARMNLPGSLSNNWHWRFLQESLDKIDQDWIKEITEVYGRS